MIKENSKNPYCKTFFNIGFIGDGNYVHKTHKNIYNTWVDMLRRCYEPYYLNRYPSYIDCYVCEEWHNFQNFAKWYEENIYNCNNERMHLDKDILIKGNKIYSPETCIFVPERINMLFTKRQKCRGKYPIGVCYMKRNNKLQSACHIIKNKKKTCKFLGYFPLNKPFQAFYAYKIFKESYIKQVADEYKDSIPQKLYNALYKWEVEIND